MNNTITLNRNSTRADRSKYLAQCAVSKGRHMITLREARENTKRSSKEAAEASGISLRTLKRWEVDCGRAELSALHRLCKYYGISMSHIFPGKEEDLLVARKEASDSEKQTIKAEDIVALLRHMGHDTTEIEKFLEGIRESREAETKNASSAPTPETLSKSHM